MEQEPASEEEECIKGAYEFFYKQLDERKLRKYLNDKYDKDVIDSIEYVDIL